MKNFFRLMMAAAVIFGAVSCAKSDVEVVGSGEVKTTLTVSLADLGTRLAGDAAAIDKVEWGIYDEAGNFLAPHSSNGQPVDFANGQAEINVMLFVGKKYDLVFWAYNSGNTAYTVDWTARQLNVDYSAQKANVEANDAFFHIENGFIAGPSKTFTLKRPFAQLNAGQSMEDYNNMQLTGNSIIKSAAKTKAYAAMDLKTGAVVGSMVDVELTMNDVIDVDANGANDHLVLASGEEYKHLAMNYLLVNERELVDVELTLLGDEGTEFVRPYYQVPVQRNYRTNILGMLISAPSVFTVVIDAAFETEHLNVLHAFQHGGEVTLQQNLYVGHPLVVKKGVNAVLNLNGRKIINYTTNEEPNTDVIIVEEGATLTINGDNNGNSEVRAVSGNSGYAVISEGTLIVNGGTFNSGKDAEGKTNAVLYARGNGKIYVNGGVFPNAQETGFVLNKKDADRATTEIVVKGGKFTNFDPANNAAEGAGTNFCAPNYGSYVEVIDGKNVYTVITTYGIVIDTTVDNVTDLKAALADSAVNGIALKAGEYDLDAVVYLAQPKGLLSIDGQAVVKGKLVANADFIAANVEFKPNATTKTALSTATYGSKVNGKSYYSIFTINKAAATFGNCKFTDLNGTHSGNAITYFTEAPNKMLVVDNCHFAGNDQAIYSKVLCEVKNSTFDINGGVPLYVWPRTNETTNSVCTFVNNTAISSAYCQVGLLTQSGNYNDIVFNVQGNGGPYTYTYGWTNSVRCATDGSVTFAPGSKTFNIASDGKPY